MPIKKVFYHVYTVNYYYELEIAIVICKEGKNIKAENAREFIGGFTIYNDISARKIQSSEMKLNLGPAKGKDFANIFGPFVVTRDEIYENEISNGKIDLEMKCKINNELYSIGNLKTMHWSFEEIIERVSYGTKIFPGDVIGSGTVGKGCLLEINGKPVETFAKAIRTTSTNNVLITFRSVFVC